MGGFAHPVSVCVHGPCQTRGGNFRILSENGKEEHGRGGQLTLSQSGYIVHAGIWFMALLRMLGDSVLALCRVGFFF
jgi:hypothetical protein